LEVNVIINLYHTSKANIKFEGLTSIILKNSFNIMDVRKDCPLCPLSFITDLIKRVNAENTVGQSSSDSANNNDNNFIT